MTGVGEARVVAFVVPVLLPFVYLLGCWILGGLGWRALARRHPAKASAGRRIGRLWCGSVHLGLFARYSGCVVWELHEEGIRLSTWFFLRCGHSPIFLPWEGLAFVPARRFVLQDGLELRVVGERVAVWMPWVQAQRLRRMSERFWPIDSGNVGKPGQQTQELSGGPERGESPEGRGGDDATMRVGDGPQRKVV